MDNIQTINRIPAKQRKTIHFYPKSFVMLCIILILSFIEYRYNVTPVDEGCAILALVILVLSIPKFTRRDTVTFMIIGVSVAIGLFGNLIFDLNNSWFSVFVDVLSQLKMPLAFFATKYALNAKEKQQTIEMLVPIAKVYVVVNAFLAILSQFVNTPFSGVTRYGIRSYLFLFNFTQQYSTITFIMLGALVCSEKLAGKMRTFFIVCGVIAAVAPVKSFSLIFTAVFVVFTFYFRSHTRIDLRILIPFVILILLLSTYQINTYLLNENSPRRLFIQYAAVDANQHFPLGSGFGTFGSSEAAKNYSPLYYEYHFNERWGMSPQYRQFLSDTYWPTVIGQLGWIGGALFIVMYVRIFIGFGLAPTSTNRKAFLYAMFSQYAVHAIGSAILQSSAGFLGFIMLSLCTLVDKDKESMSNRVKFHVET